MLYHFLILFIGIQKEFIDISENKFIILLGKQKPHVVHIHRITPYANVFLIYEVV